MTPDRDPIVELARVPNRIPRIDLVIAAGLMVWALLEAILIEGPGSPVARVALAIGFTAPLALRRRWPMAVICVIVSLSILRGIVGDLPEDGSMPTAPLLLASFSAALYARPAALAIAAIPLPPIGVFLGGFEGDPTLSNYGIFFFLTLGAWGAGWLVRRRADAVRRARAAAPLLAEEAVAGERARLARELHDVVAHAVSAISVQAGAAEEQLDRDPERARAHLEAVRRTAREALAELRRLVGVLREDDAVYAPQPGLERVGELLDEARRNGLEVELREEGSRPAVPAGVDLAAYRIVQESLTNVRRHAGDVQTSVLVRYAPQAIELEVANEAGDGNGAAGEGSGHGLIGMRERARLYGGSFEAGPRADGGYAVRATLPLEEPA